MEWIIGIIVLWIAWKLLTSKYRRELAMKQIIVDAYIHHESEIVYSKIYWEAAKRYAEDHGATIDEYFHEDSFNYDTYINKVKVHVYIAKDSSGYAFFRVEEHKKMMQKFNEKFGIIDESWIERLWAWADENDVGDLEWIKPEYYDEDGYYTGLPRDKKSLLALRELNLRSNQLTELQKEIGNLSNLTELVLWSNQLTELPKEIGNLRNLTTLDLGGNQLTELPKEIGNLRNLTTLDLEHNQLTELPKEIWNLSNLTKLDLEGNQLTEFPKEIGNLSNLTKLVLEHNQLTELPKEIWNLSNLTELVLRVNQLTELPKEIGNLRSLTTLDLGGTQLTELPKEIWYLRNLTTLDLERNQLKELPKEIRNLRNLTTLNLWGNPNLILTQEQKGWIKRLEENVYGVFIDDDLLDRNINYDEIPF
jgi:hypothetical protein